jgi:hypothetical protein
MTTPRTPLAQLLELAEQQLAAARSLSVERLATATRMRSELLFELQVSGQPIDGDRETLQRLTHVDRRLQHVLSAALGIFEAGTRTRQDPTYGNNGRLRRRT